MNNLPLIFIICCLSAFGATAQIRLTGVIKDMSGRPIEGVTVTVKNTKDQAKSGLNGNFTVHVSDSVGTLFLESVAYRPKAIAYDAGSFLKGLEITLEQKEESIDEVEVFSTGYQRIPKERATGSFASVSEKTFNEQVSTDVLSRLEAIANGVSVNRTAVGAPGLTIRGASTIIGQKSPLIVVDDFPYEGDINNLNPNDVASVVLLKDAAAASIWGARAGNGVIVITTKKGALNQPLEVAANANITAGSLPDLHAIPTLSSTHYIEVEKFLFENKHRFSDTASRSRPPFTPVYELLFSKMKGDISQAELDAELARLEQVDIRDQYRNSMYRSALNQQYALSLKGGTKHATWLFSGGYDRNINSLHAHYDRLNLNFQNTYTPRSWITLSTSIRYTNSANTGGRTEYGTIRMNNRDLPPYTRFVDDLGEFLPITRMYRQGYVDTVGAGRLLDWNYYMDDYQHVQGKGTLDHVLMNGGVTMKLTKWMAVDVKYQYDRQGNDTEVLYGAESFFTRNLINQYTQLSEGQPAKYIVPLGSVYDPSQSKMVSHAFRSQLNIDHRWSDHELIALLGMEVKDNASNSWNTRFYGYNADIGTFGNVDYTTTYPSIVTGSRSFVPNNTGFSGAVNKFVSVFSNIAYAFNSKYVLTASVRRDASNLFGVNTNDKWNFLWSLGAAWNVHDESFYRAEWLPYLKLRFTHGFSGNVDLGRSAVTTINYVSTPNPYTQHRVAHFRQYGDPELRWEKVGMTNIALDYGIRGNRINGSIDLFFKRGTDLFGPAPIDYTTGTAPTLTKNVASIKGKGLDALVNSVNLTGRVKWTTNLNFSWYIDEVSDYFRSDLKGSGFVTQQRPNISGVVGRPLYSFLSYPWRGLDGQTGDPVGMINGRESKNYNAITGDSTMVSDLVYHGSATPRVYGSLGNTFSYKGISLSLRLLYSMGYYYRRTSVQYNSLFATGAGAHPDYEKRWRQPGDEQFTSVPSMLYPTNSNRDNFYAHSEVTAERGDHIRLQYINLSYDLARSFAKMQQIKQFYLYANLANIGVLWEANSEGLDPEYRGTVPPPLTFSMGIKVVF